MRIGGIVVTLLLIFSQTLLGVSALEAPKAIGKITGFHEDKGHSTSTGFVINESGLIVTAAHGVAGVNGLMIDVQGEIYTLEVLAMDEDMDIALLRPSDTVSKKFISLEFTTNKPFRFSEVTVFGFPFGASRVDGGPIKSVGRVFIESSPHDYLDILIAPGNSGSPVFNEDFEVVGVVLAVTREDSGRLCAMSIDSELILKRFAKELK
jgi:S1-C subfamily serine protease